MIKVIIFLFILFACFIVVNNVVKRKEPYQKSADFFKQKENFDVLFFGSSHTINGFFSMDLWKNYGMVSYNMGNHGEKMATTYYNILLACKHTKPKLIVVDTFYVLNNSKVPEKGADIHKMLDIYPVSYLKYEAINDLFDGKDILNKEFEYLFYFSMYHNRWNETNKNDFKDFLTYEKGAESRINVAKPNRMSDFEEIEMYNEDETINMHYLRRIITYCNQNNINLLLTYLPYPAYNHGIAASKYISKICEEYNANYINFLNMDIVNYNIDCYDADNHLNPSGARKVTDYIGKYIKENYDIPDQRENESYSFWNKDYDEYIDFKIENLKKNKTNLNNYLMLLYGEDDISYDIKISSKRQIEDGSVLQQLLKNLNNNYEISDDEFVSNANKTIKITIKDNRNGKVIDTVWF